MLYASFLEATMLCEDDDPVEFEVREFVARKLLSGLIVYFSGGGNFVVLANPENSSSEISSY